MRITLDPSNVDDYRTFLKVKELPTFKFSGRTAVFPDEYAERLGVDVAVQQHDEYVPYDGLFDYQRDIARMAVDKGKFAVFADCGLGKTFILTEFAREALNRLPDHKRVLIVSPIMVCGQTISEAERFYGDELPIERVYAKGLQSWLDGAGSRLAITNYDALHADLTAGQLGALILDESSMLKSQYGAWGQACIKLGEGLDYKLAATGTPAPNDRIEYANHAVLLDAFPTINSFLARFFVNRGETGNRWELKPHAIGPFYRELSHWCIFLTDPAVYGWTDNTRPLPPIHIHYHDVPLTEEQRDLAYDTTGDLFAHNPGGIGSRSVLSQIAKGSHKGKPIASNKPGEIKRLVDSWPDESTIIWCKYNAEQDAIAKMIPGSASIEGTTPLDKREQMIADFKAGRTKVLISKPKVLGFGLNLQVATRQIWSGLQDSYEEFYQGVKRSNRYGSTLPLNVHIPVTDIERPMIDNVMRKADRIDTDTRHQEELFRAFIN